MEPPRSYAKSQELVRSGLSARQASALYSKRRAGSVLGPPASAPSPAGAAGVNEPYNLRLVSHSVRVTRAEAHWRWRGQRDWRRSGSPITAHYFQIITSHYHKACLYYFLLFRNELGSNEVITSNYFPPNLEMHFLLSADRRHHQHCNIDET
jgi:hypothetical protein